MTLLVVLHNGNFSSDYCKLVYMLFHVANNSGFCAIMLSDSSLFFGKTKVEKVHNSINHTLFALLNEAAVFKPGSNIFGNDAAQYNNREPEVQW